MEPKANMPLSKERDDMIFQQVELGGYRCRWEFFSVERKKLVDVILCKVMSAFTLAATFSCMIYYSHLARQLWNLRAFLRSHKCGGRIQRGRRPA